MDVSHVKHLFPGRESLIDELFFKLESNWPLLFVHGHRGTGKSSIVLQVLAQSGLKTSVQDLREGCSARDIFTRILLDYSKTSEMPLFDLMADCTCSDVTSFVDKVSQLKRKDRLVLVLDSAEVLVHADPFLMNCLCKLHEVLSPHDLQLTVILISCQPFLNFLRPGVAHLRPLVIHFASYNKDQLLLILKSRRRVTGFTDETFENYAQLVLSVLFDVTRNVAEIGFVCDSNFDAYTEPIRRGEVQERESAKLWRLFEPQLRLTVSAIALKGKTTDSESEEMPFAMKFLLISAFLASFNSKKSDRRFFLKSQSNRKTGRRVADQSQRSGPKAFPLERLLHIYQSLLHLNFEFDDEESGVLSGKRLMRSNEVFSLLEDLLSLKLLTRVGATGSTISSIKKWRISDSVTYEYLSAICESVQFDLTSHLEEFAFRK